MISAQNITYEVQGKTLLSNVSVDFSPNTINLIIGPNGAGKSTLMNVLSGQLQPKSGNVFYSDKNLASLQNNTLAKHRAVLSQQIELAFPMEVHEVVMMGRYPHFDINPTKKDEQACQEAMDFFDVAQFRNRNYMTLSGGEKQRVNFARVAAQIWFEDAENYRYLLLDEPLTFLDIHYQFDFMHKLRTLLAQQNLVVVGVVHDLNLAAKFADQIVLINHGKIIAAGAKEIVLTEKIIEETYQLKPIIHTEKNNMYLFFE